MVIVIVIVIVIEVMMLVFVLGRARFSTVCAAAFGHAMCGGYEHGVLSSFPSSSSYCISGRYGNEDDDDDISASSTETR